MKKLNSSVAVAALAAVLSTPAIAADIEAPIVPEERDWTALHIGVGVGGNFAFVEADSNISFVNFNNNFFAFADSFSDLGDAGFFGTVEAGFDWQIGSSIVVGVLANYDFGKTKMDTEFLGAEGNFNNNNIFNITSAEARWKIGDSWAVGGRIGFLVDDSALVYVLGGYTSARVETEISMDFNNFNSQISFDDKSWEDGYFVGGGIEALLTDSISIKAEYRFNDYGKVDFEDGFVAGENANVFGDAEMSGDVTVHSVRAVLSYRFGL